MDDAQAHTIGQIKHTALEVAARDLIAFACAHPFNPNLLQPPPLGSTRDFEHEGNEYRATLSRLIVPDGVPLPPELGGGTVPKSAAVYLLSISKRNAVPDAIGRLLPTSEEAAEIAKAFFPRGCVVLADQSDPLKGSRKYFGLV